MFQAFSSIFRTFTFMAVLLFFTPSAAAQELPDTTITETIYLSDVLVQNERFEIPFSLSNRDIIVLDARVIQTLPVSSVNELLSYVAGIDIRQRSPWGGQTDVSINGGTFDQTLVLLDGIRVSDPQTGHLMMNLPVTPEAISRIEILKGAAASAYGVNAINGAINIITKLPENNEVVISAASGSSFERDTSSRKLYGAAGLTLSAGFGSENARHFISLNTQQTSGYRYNTAMNNNKAFYRSRFKLPGNNSINVNGGFIYNDFGANGFYAPPGDIESKETVQTGLASVTGSFRMTDRWLLKPELSYRYNHDNYIFVRQNPALYQNLHTTHVINTSLNNTIDTKLGIFGFGAEFRTEQIRSNSLGNRGRDNFGLFAEYGLTTAGGFILNAGTYLNYSKHFAWQWLPSADIGYKIDENWHVFVNAGTGTRLPTYTDWYYNGPENIGNSHLKPEKAVHTETGFKFSSERLRISGSFFYRETRDFIDWVKNDLSEPWQPHNFQNIKTPGINLDVDYRIFRPVYRNKFSYSAGISYTWLNPRQTAPGGQNFAYSHYSLENLKNQLVLRFSAVYLEHFTILAAARYEERANYKDYLLFDAKLEEQLGALKINLSINNAANVTYIETGAVPLPGRWVSAGLTWKL